MARALDITGEVYGQLTAISSTGEKSNNGSYIWNFKCLCGDTVQRPMTKVRYTQGNSACSECLKKEMSIRKTTHGTPSHDKTYNAWRSMKRRCLNESDPRYKYYGAIGISVHEGWIDDFPAFREHIGQPPCGNGKYSVDRINNNLGYVPNNVRWATITQQARNKGKSSNNTSGITGVTWELNIIKTRYATATWSSLDKKSHSKRFSAKKYGDELAFFIACEYREQMINLLNIQGAGYTESHGKLKEVK